MFHRFYSLCSSVSRVIEGESRQSFTHQLSLYASLYGVRRGYNYLKETRKDKPTSELISSAFLVIIGGARLLLQCREMYQRISLEHELTCWKETCMFGDIDEVVRRISRVINGSSWFLDLSDCSLLDIPSVVWKLLSLRDLNISGNSITDISEDIGQLTKLCILHLDGNRITTLPRAMGQLQELEMLNISGNAVQHMPVEIVNLPRLRGIFNRDPRVSLEREEEINSILTQRRQGNLLVMLPTLVEKWKDLCHVDSHDHSLDYINTLGDKRKSIIAGWLDRIQKIPEYTTNNIQVVTIVYDILKFINRNMEFQELFFDHTEMNNTACTDRAGMALNEIYTAYKIATLTTEENGNSKIEDRITMLLKAVKTHAFRTYIAEWIRQHQPDNNESVEIFLFYEASVGVELGLLSILQIENMAYGVIGDKSEILPVQQVIDDVNDMYLNYILDVPLLEALITQDPTFIDVWEPQQHQYQAELAELNEEELGYDSYNQEILRITNLQHSMKIQCCQDWLRNRKYI